MNAAEKLDDKSIALDIDGGKVTVRPIGYLGRDFRAYKDACDANGCRSKKDASGNWQQVAHLANVAGLVAGLRAAGFEPIVSAELAARVSTTVEIAKTEVADAKARLAIVNARLAERGEKLYPYQEIGVPWLAARSKGVLGDDMGLGKTVQALLAAPDDAPILVIAPALVNGNWINEAKRWRPDLASHRIMRGRGVFEWPKPGEIVVTHYGILPKMEPGEGRSFKLPALYGEPLPGTVLIVDEAHAVKTPKTQQTKAVRVVARMVRAAGGRTWPMTGTPILNRPPELWTLLDTFDLAQEAYGTWTRFRGIFGGRQGKFGTEWGGRIDMDAAVAGLRRVMLRRESDDVLGLPEVAVRDIVVELDDKTRKLADAFVASLAERGLSLDDAFALAKSGDGGMFEEISKMRAALALAKIGAMSDLVDEYLEAGEHPVVFCYHRAPIEALAEKPRAAAILGGVDTLDRTEIVRKFQDGELDVLGLTYGAGGVGITVTRAKRVIEVDWPWTPALVDQARARIRRIGQKSDRLFADRLVANHPLDEHVMEVNTGKRKLIAETVTAAKTMGAAVELLPEALPDDLVVVDKFEAPKTPEEIRVAAMKARHEAKGPESKFRPASGPVEEWAARGVGILAMNDPDRAAEENGVGFNKADGGYGHWLASMLAATGGELPGDQWPKAVRMLAKYHGQIGAKPSEEGAE